MTKLLEARNKVRNSLLTTLYGDWRGGSQKNLKNGSNAGKTVKIVWSFAGKEYQVKLSTKVDNSCRYLMLGDRAGLSHYVLTTLFQKMGEEDSQNFGYIDVVAFYDYIKSTKLAQNLLDIDLLKNYVACIDSQRMIIFDNVDLLYFKDPSSYKDFLHFLDSDETQQQYILVTHLMSNDLNCYAGKLDCILTKKQSTLLISLKGEDAIWP